MLCRAHEGQTVCGLSLAQALLLCRVSTVQLPLGDRQESYCELTCLTLFSFPRKILVVPFSFVYLKGCVCTFPECLGVAGCGKGGHSN